MSDTSDAAAERLESWLKSQIRRAKEWRKDVAEAARDCLNASEATDKQQEIAREILRELKVIGDGTEYREYRAFQLGLLYEDMRLAVLSGPAKIGVAMGTDWRRCWINATRLEQRILEQTRYVESVALFRFVSAVWNKRFDPKKRNYVDKAIHGLNIKLAAAKAPNIHVRGDHVIVDSVS